MGVLPGAFNPVTNAHVALAKASIEQHRLEQIVFLLPEVFPHKEYAGASFDERLALLEAALSGEPLCAIASSDRGLFIEIAEAVRDGYGPEVEIFLICGRDAADRIVNWDYGDGPNFAKQLRQFQMLVGSRGEGYEVPARHQGRIYSVKLPLALSEVSATEVRQAVRRNEAWEHLVSPAVAHEIVRRKLYLA